MSILCSCVASSLPPGFELRVIVNGRIKEEFEKLGKRNISNE